MVGFRSFLVRVFFVTLQQSRMKMTRLNFGHFIFLQFLETGDGGGDGSDNGDEANFSSIGWKQRWRIRDWCGDRSRGRTTSNDWVEMVIIKTNGLKIKTKLCCVELQMGKKALTPVLMPFRAHDCHKWETTIIAELKCNVKIYCSVQIADHQMDSEAFGLIYNKTSYHFLHTSD